MGRIGGDKACDALAETTWRRRGRARCSCPRGTESHPVRPGGVPKVAEKRVAPVSAKLKSVKGGSKGDTRTDSIGKPFLFQSCEWIPHLLRVVCSAFVHVHKLHEFSVQVRVTEGLVRHEGRVEMLVLRVFEVAEMGELRLAIGSMSIQW